MVSAFPWDKRLAGVPVKRAKCINLCSYEVKGVGAFR